MAPKAYKVVQPKVKALLEANYRATLTPPQAHGTSTQRRSVDLDVTRAAANQFGVAVGSGAWRWRCGAISRQT